MPDRTAARRTRIDTFGIDCERFVKELVMSKKTSTFVSTNGASHHKRGTPMKYYRVIISIDGHKSRTEFVHAKDEWKARTLAMMKGRLALATKIKMHSSEVEEKETTPLRGQYVSYEVEQIGK